jgi:2-polyprenyl-3-methyl-5-hydroxy-6-metoxy-1,4-benzoquinol methylase
MRDVDFGTYHHSTPEESEKIREFAEKAFSRILRPLCRSRTNLQVLDAGCGLGFLTYVAAKCFPQAIITGVDLFRPSSMSEISIDKAVNNMKSLGIRLAIRSRTVKSRIPQYWQKEIQRLPDSFRFA